MLDLIVSWLLRIIAFYLLFEWARRWSKGRVRLFPKSKHWIVVFLLTALPVVAFYVVNDPLEAERPKSLMLEVLTAVFFSGAISGMWAMFIRKLDIFEQESWLSIGLTILLGAVFTFAVFPLNSLLLGDWEMQGTFLNDLLYTIFAIGGIEEFVKLIPVMLIARFTKWINEPLDWILYCSFSALGFAFVENTMYILNSEFVAIPARAFLSSVGHMTFASFIGYSIMVAVEKGSSMLVAILKGFIFAIITHGLYDFWLMYRGLGDLSTITFLLFLGLVHTWFQMLNNGINLSPFYSKLKVLRNKDLLAYLTLSVLSVLAMSITGMALKHGLVEAFKQLSSIVYAYGYLAVYLVLTLSQTRVIDRLFKPIQFTLDAIFPVQKKD